MIPRPLSLSRFLVVLLGSATVAVAQSLVSMPSVMSGGSAGTVRSFAVSGSTLYIGGTFDSVGGEARSNLAAINLNTGTVTSWNPGASDTVNGLALSGDGSSLYVGGAFTTLGGSSRNYLGELSTSSGSATTWNPNLDNAVNGLVRSSATGTVFALGDFSTASGGGVTANKFVGVTAGGSITGFTGSTTFASSDMRSFAVSNDGSTIYIAHIGNKSWDAAAGGTVSRAGVTALRTSDFLATAFNPNLQENIFASPGQSLAVSGNTLYVGGQFDNVGGVPSTSTGTTRQRIAGYDLTSTGEDGTLNTSFAPTSSANGANAGGTRGLAVIGDSLYVIGGFSAYAGTALNGIAKVDATDGTLDPTYLVTTSASLFGNHPTYSFADATNGYLFISSSVIAGATVLGEVQTNSFIVLSTPSAVPEPSTYAAIGGVLALGAVLWRRRRGAA